MIRQQKLWSHPNDRSKKKFFTLTLNKVGKNITNKKRNSTNKSIYQKKKQKFIFLKLFIQI